MRARGTVAPSPGAAVTVGSVRVPATELEAAAARSAGARPGRLAGARKAAANRAIERLWLKGEAAARRLRPAANLGVLRAQVADALVGDQPPADAARLAAGFDAYHERWRARTRCLRPTVTPPRIAAETARAPRPARAIGWERRRCARQGRRPPCLARRPRSTIRARRDVVRFRSRAKALAVAAAVYAVARAPRARVVAAARAAAERAAAARAQAAQRARLARERRQRAASRGSRARR